MRILVVNAGSSSLKLRVLDDEDSVVASGDMEAEDSVADWVADCGAVDAAGHRVVHGGGEFTAPVVVDDAVRARLEQLVELAPLHQPASLRGVDAVRDALPDIPSVACFDTAFHASLPAEAATYAVPAEWRTRFGLRRYGFHGISHAYASRRGAELLGRPLEELRIVTCHLGSGASLAAVRGGRSVDTTMGFTPLEGLVMATRSGSVDPGMLVWLQQQGGVGVGEIGDALEHRSGLAGLAGTGDMRVVLERAAAGDADASLALDVYVHRLCGGIAAMAAAMSGMDALVFTGGVGERAPAIRQRTAERLSFLGVVVLDESGDDRGDRSITASGAAVHTFVVEAREDIEIAASVRSLLAAHG